MWRMATFLAFGCAACTGHNPDYLPPLMGCNAGERACSGGRPLECDLADGGTLLVNSPCPSAGTCSDGHCNPPSGAGRCTRAADCAPGQVCTAFVESDHIATFCTAPEGPLGGVSGCTASPQCATDLCLISATKVGLCFLACNTDSDCGSLTMQCRRFSVTITGVEGTVSGCAPK
jgi:hypothetical protein